MEAANISCLARALSGDAPLNCWLPDAPRDVAFLPLLPNPPDGPLSFITDADLDALTVSLQHTGMIGAFNRYRASAFDATESADIIGAPVTQPSRFIAVSAIRCGRSSPAPTAMRTRARRAPTFAAARSFRVPGTGFTKRGRPRRTRRCSRFFSRWSNRPTEYSWARLTPGQVTKTGNSHVRQAFVAWEVFDPIRIAVRIGERCAELAEALAALTEAAPDPQENPAADTVA